MAPEEEGLEAARLLARLRALASPVRLQLLQSLVSPARPHDLRVRAAGGRAGMEAERFLGRSTVIEHLDLLTEAGLVRRVDDAYAVDQQGMVAFLQDLGALARLRAVVEVDVESTLAAPSPSNQPVAAPPRLVVANGPEAGRAFALHGPGPWRVGRLSACEVPLVHDPHVSRLQATLHREGGAFVVEVAPSAKNVARVDFADAAPGARVPLRSGSVLGLGATALVLQA
ncbi:MAG TPA: FHA domain-containing protein [Candidatus Thermoplasmatota archaeon]|nr:FHA domain-containing protein [Candidatus Thermoplasmatota archaeon]